MPLQDEDYDCDYCKKRYIVSTKGDPGRKRWHSFRLLHAVDDMKLTLTDSILAAGFEMHFWDRTTSSKAEALMRAVTGYRTIEDYDEISTYH